MQLAEFQAGLWCQEEGGAVVEAGRAERECRDTAVHPPALQTVSDTAPPSSSSLSLLVTVVVVSLCCAMAVTLPCLTAFVFRSELSVWLHSKHGIRLGRHHQHPGSVYHVLVSHGPGETEFVQQVNLVKKSQDR